LRPFGTVKKGQHRADPESLEVRAGHTPTVEELRSDRQERRREDGTGKSFYTEDINF
jgi:hypothetical protein